MTHSTERVIAAGGGGRPLQCSTYLRPLKLPLHVRAHFLIQAPHFFSLPLAVQSVAARHAGGEGQRWEAIAPPYVPTCVRNTATTQRLILRRQSPLQYRQITPGCLSVAAQGTPGGTRCQPWRGRLPTCPLRPAPHQRAPRQRCIRALLQRLRVLARVVVHGDLLGAPGLAAHIAGRCERSKICVVRTDPISLEFRALATL